jgi:hypothetical protein
MDWLQALAWLSFSGFNPRAFFLAQLELQLFLVQRLILRCIFQYFPHMLFEERDGPRAAVCFLKNATSVRQWHGG